MSILFIREIFKLTLDYFQYDYLTKTILMSTIKDSDYPIISLIFIDDYPYIAQEYYRRIHNMSLYDSQGYYNDYRLRLNGVPLFNQSLKGYYIQAKNLRPADHAQLIFEMHNLTARDLFNRDMFSKHFWYKSNIDSEQFVRQSSRNYSIGYYFQNTEQVGPSRFDHFRLFTMLSIKPQLYSDNNINKVLIVGGVEVFLGYPLNETFVKTRNFFQTPDKIFKNKSILLDLALIRHIEESISRYLFFSDKQFSIHSHSVSNLGI